VPPLDRAEPGGRHRSPAPPIQGPSDQTLLVADLGIAHELRYLESLEAEGRSVGRLQGQAGGAARAEQQVVQAMQEGVDVIYEATPFDGTWGGQADFLLKTSTPSEHLGDWSYEVADAKLARRIKVPALLQMATYADRLAVLQGRAPDRVCVVTGDGVLRPFRLVDVAAYTRRARARLETFIAAPPVTGFDGAMWRSEVPDFSAIEA
jgi:predicted RecB family nuclease